MASHPEQGEHDKQYCEGDLHHSSLLVSMIHRFYKVWYGFQKSLDSSQSDHKVIYDYKENTVEVIQILTNKSWYLSMEYSLI